MKNLSAIVVNGLKKALAWYIGKKNSAGGEDVQQVSQPESKKSEGFKLNYIIEGSARPVLVIGIAIDGHRDFSPNR